MTIIILIAIFGISFLMMLLIFIFQKTKKGAVGDFERNNQSKAILHLYGNSPKIDGISVKELDYIKGEHTEYIVALTAGEHSILSKYSIT